MRVLVTGGAGFIGSHVTDAMVAMGHRVAVLDNLSTGSRGNLNQQAAFYHVDMTDGKSVDRLFREFRPEVVIHHAAQIDVRISTNRPVFDAQVNILGTINLLTSAVQAGTGKIIYASSGGAIYGEPEHLPVREDHPIQAISPYGVSKYTVEHYVKLYAKNYGIQYTILRYPNVYGPRQNPYGEGGVIAIFSAMLLQSKPCTIFGDGGQLRDYIYVGDIVDANVRALDRGNSMTVNLGSGVGTSVNEVYSKLAAITGSAQKPISAPERMGEIRNSYLDASLAKKVLGWSPQTSLIDGLRETVDWIRERALMEARSHAAVAEQGKTV